jgi:hypothetical protein
LRANAAFEGLNAKALTHCNLRLFFNHATAAIDGIWYVAKPFGIIAFSRAA